MKIKKVPVIYTFDKYIYIDDKGVIDVFCNVQEPFSIINTKLLYKGPVRFVSGDIANIETLINAPFKVTLN